MLAFALDPKTGKLTKLNEQPVNGSGPCHINVDRAGKNVLIANYGGGSANVFPIGEDGKLKEITGFIQHAGKGVNPANKRARTPIPSTCRRTTASPSWPTWASTRSSFTSSTPTRER